MTAISDFLLLRLGMPLYAIFRPVADFLVSRLMFGLYFIIVTLVAVALLLIAIFSPARAMITWAGLLGISLAGHLSTRTALGRMIRAVYLKEEIERRLKAIGGADVGNR